MGNEAKKIVPVFTQKSGRAGQTCESQESRQSSNRFPPNRLCFYVQPAVYLNVPCVERMWLQNN